MAQKCPNSPLTLAAELKVCYNILSVASLYLQTFVEASTLVPLRGICRPAPPSQCIFRHIDGPSDIPPRTVLSEVPERFLSFDPLHETTAELPGLEHSRAGNRIILTDAFRETTIAGIKASGIGHLLPDIFDNELGGFLIVPAERLPVIYWNILLSESVGAWISKGRPRQPGYRPSLFDNDVLGRYAYLGTWYYLSHPDISAAAVGVANQLSHVS